MLHSDIWLVALVEILECLWSLCLQVGHQTINSMMHVAHQYLSFVKLSPSFNPPQSIIFSLVQSLQRLMQMMLECPHIKFHSQWWKCSKLWDAFMWPLLNLVVKFAYPSSSNSSINPWLNFPSSGCLFKRTDSVSTPINLLIKHIYMITFTSWQ